ncbi:hypothetical protein AXG93_4360s1280 [Marchantia polymorpha subsp. ruderalis]|uniref:Uncharacterized protein n=1 Tax=Marchantia polymorpha subsp. ruderalis TaxID=1480154 RepID=A0A176W1D6_MARPO|nr:hypothetical protein AXG93_4360s1280 [Marchantia polymorpha subsp. ruderalis]
MHRITLTSAYASEAGSVREQDRGGGSHSVAHVPQQRLRQGTGPAGDDFGKNNSFHGGPRPPGHVGPGPTSRTVADPRPGLAWPGQLSLGMMRTRPRTRDEYRPGSARLGSARLGSSRSLPCRAGMEMTGHLWMREGSTPSSTVLRGSDYPLSTPLDQSRTVEADCDKSARGAPALQAGIRHTVTEYILAHDDTRPSSTVRFIRYAGLSRSSIRSFDPSPDSSLPGNPRFSTLAHPFLPGPFKIDLFAACRSHVVALVTGDWRRSLPDRLCLTDGLLQPCPRFAAFSIPGRRHLQALAPRPHPTPPKPKYWD